MSRALSVYHGPFGRATLYELNRPMTTHAHREGHLTFYVGGGEACVSVRGTPHGLTDALWRSRSTRGSRTPSRRTTASSGGVYLVLYIDRTGSQPHGPERSQPLHFGRSEIEMTPRISARGRARSCRCSRTTTPRRTSTARCSS